MEIRPIKDADRDALVGIWLRSVRATHAFLTERDVQDLLPVVRDVVLRDAGLGAWVLEFAPCEPAAFMGLAFYLQNGFVQAGRSERDSAGRPFPILHLREA
jgi:putative acetyltransferase